MHKEELINLHQMLYDVKIYFETLNPELKFAQYNALKITPSQQHKSKMEHKHAIFVLNRDCQRYERCGLLLLKQDIGTHEGTCR